MLLCPRKQVAPGEYLARCAVVAGGEEEILDVDISYELRNFRNVISGLRIPFSIYRVLLRIRFFGFPPVEDIAQPFS